MSKRREARECALQALYAYELSGDGVEHHVDNILHPKLGDTPQTLNFAKRLLICTIAHHEEADEYLGNHTKNWDIGRIALVDKILLRIAITEFLYFPDIPPKVSINEAIEIAKRFSTARSGNFINGILDAVLEELNDIGALKKTGRGLIEATPAHTK